MRTEAHLVLQRPLVVDRAGPRAILRELQADARELVEAPVEHRARLARGPVLETAVVEALGAQADAPPFRELVDALHVPAGLHRLTFAIASQVFALQLEVRARRVAVGRPLPA